MNWNFECAPKNITLENGSLNLKLIENIKNIVPEHITWTVQEKIQGIGLGISYNKESELHFCIRPLEYKNLLYTFHLAEKAVIKIEEKIKKLFDSSEAANEIIVYGKIVPSVNCDDDFYAFALIIDEIVQDTHQYIGLLEDCKILFSQMLVTAPLDKCLDLSSEVGSEGCELILQPSSPMYNEDGWRIVLKK